MVGTERAIINKGKAEKPAWWKRNASTMIYLCALLITLILSATPSYAIKKKKLDLLHRIHTYGATIDTSTTSKVNYVYSRSTMRVEKRNVTLKLVPTAYVVTRGKEREFLSESYNKINISGLNKYTIQPLLRITTVPHRRDPMRTFERYLMPDIYDETIIGNTLLSPFHPLNFRFYKYHIDDEHDGVIALSFQPKRKNTQLVKGSANIDNLTGRIISVNFRGEYDMVHFWVSMTMNRRGYVSLFPSKCEALLRFKFLGNRVSGHYKTYFGLHDVLGDSIDANDAPRLISLVRPDTLNDMEKGIYNRIAARKVQDSINAANDTVKHKKKWVKNVLWDAIGDNVLNRIKSNFGMNNRGYVRLNPILNPLYMGYDHRRGFTYKVDVRASYQLNDNSELTGRFKGGYAFKQRRFYFNLPIYYYFNKRKNGYVSFEMASGNRIGNARIREDIMNEYHNANSIIDLNLLNEFKHSYYRLVANYDFNNVVGIKLGALYQRMNALHKYAFHLFGWQSAYSSFAPVFELEIRPWGWNGPIFTADYDRAIKDIFNTNMSYERLEFNGEYIHHLNKLQSLQMRLGGGFYTMKGRRTYFLNYENFYENNIPGGWNDDWSGEFELLNGDTYNTSDYYLRANLTYESPLLILSWLPWVGKFMEMERIYISALDVETIHPYIELGYGFTTRAFSAGIFTSNGHGNRTYGIKFGFELFRNW